METDINGIMVYYCPGMDVEEYDCYMMVLNAGMFVINIEKGYGSMVNLVMDQILRSALRRLVFHYI